VTKDALKQALYPPFGAAMRTTAILARGAHNRALGYLVLPERQLAVRATIFDQANFSAESAPCEHQASEHSNAVAEPGR
jgi:hypothetical protein